jgi:N-acetylmuramoyl-L-alanine amidase
MLELIMINMPSPNFNDRPDGTEINSIIIHYTGMKTAQDALDRLCDSAAEVSAHYTIDMDGTIYNHVDPTKRAWHAGVSQWGKLSNFNDFSIGIELVNKGHEFGYHAFPDAQIDALVDLMKGLYKQFPINPELVLGHSDIAPDRKQDPGELFPWDLLVQENLAVRPQSTL